MSYTSVEADAFFLELFFEVAHFSIEYLIIVVGLKLSDLFRQFRLCLMSQGLEKKFTKMLAFSRYSHIRRISI
ncbi:MAG: hypothetical protein ABII09_03185 [Planctomycetota bacterium]